MACGKISNDVQCKECEDLFTSGTMKRLIVINYDDVLKAEATITDNVISTLPIATGARGYVFCTYDNANQGTVSLEAGTYRNYLNHAVVSRAVAKDQATKDWINSGVNARVMVIVNNKHLGNAGDVQYELYGWDSGLIMTALDIDTNNTDQVYAEVTFSSDDTSKEKQLPLSVYAGTPAATKTLIESIIAA